MCFISYVIFYGMSLLFDDLTSISVYWQLDILGWNCVKTLSRPLYHSRNSGSMIMESTRVCMNILVRHNVIQQPNSATLMLSIAHKISLIQDGRRECCDLFSMLERSVHSWCRKKSDAWFMKYFYLKGKHSTVDSLTQHSRCICCICILFHNLNEFCYRSTQSTVWDNTHIATVDQISLSNHSTTVKDLCTQDLCRQLIIFPRLMWHEVRSA